MDESIAKVQSLKSELVRLGYYPYQIDRIIKENYHVDRLEHLAPEQVEDLAETLEGYVNFAVKCWKGTSIRS